MADLSIIKKRSINADRQDRLVTARLSTGLRKSRIGLSNEFRIDELH